MHQLGGIRLVERESFQEGSMVERESFHEGSMIWTLKTLPNSESLNLT